MLLGWKSVDPWNSYTITTFTVSLGVALFYPLILRAVDYAVDYFAYKFNYLSALRDGGGTAQKRELEGIKRSLINHNGDSALVGIKEEIEDLKGILAGSSLTKQEQKDALKLISDAVTNTGQDSVAAFNAGVEENKKNNANLEKLLTVMAQNLSENQKLQNEFNQRVVLQLQQSQQETAQALKLALENFSKALKESKSDET